MNKTIEINTERYERLASNRLFFLRLYENYHYDDKGHEIDYSQWQSIDRELDFHFDAGKFADRSPGYCLCIVDKSEQKKDKDGNVIEGTLIMHFHDISANSVNDWVAVFENYGARAYAKNFTMDEILDFTMILPKLVRVNKGKSVAAMHIELGWPVRRSVSLSEIIVAPAICPYTALGL